MPAENEDTRLKLIALITTGKTPREAATMTGTAYAYALKIGKQAAAAAADGELHSYTGLTVLETARLLTEATTANVAGDITTGFNLETALSGELVEEVDTGGGLPAALELAALRLVQRVHDNVTTSTPIDDCLIAAEILAKLQLSFNGKAASTDVAQASKFEAFLGD